MLDNADSVDSIVFSWDALLYGGLIQSRQPGKPCTGVEEIAALLGKIDWEKTPGYCYSTIPRLGISVAASEQYTTHANVREYFILAEGKESDEKSEKRLAELLDEIGHDNADALLRWRRRNLGNTERAMTTCSSLGVRHMHVASEDNARQGHTPCGGEGTQGGIPQADIRRLRHFIQLL